jgi:hypothetical protein
MEVNIKVLCVCVHVSARMYYHLSSYNMCYLSQTGIFFIIMSILLQYAKFQEKDVIFYKAPVNSSDGNERAPTAKWINRHSRSILSPQEVVVISRESGQQRH